MFLAIITMEEVTRESQLRPFLCHHLFQPDGERKQHFDEAIRTYDALIETYMSHNYELVEIPRTPIQDRVRFVLRKVGTDPDI